MDVCVLAAIAGVRANKDARNCPLISWAKSPWSQPIPVGKDRYSVSFEIVENNGTRVPCAIVTKIKDFYSGGTEKQVVTYPLSQLNHVKTEMKGWIVE